MMCAKDIVIKGNIFKCLFLLMGIAGILLMSPGILGKSIVLAKTTPSFNAPASFTHLVETVGPAVVNVRAVKTIKGGGPVFRHFQRDPRGPQDPFKDFFERFFGDEMQKEFKQPSLGSGFIIDKEGFVVTNNHVIENADQIKVKLNDESEFDAQVIGRDPSTDIALLKLKTDHDLPVAKLGDSGALKVGQWVVAIGSPFGLERTVTAGIVSAKGRVIGSGPYDDFIQTDASINPGNSGGPLINMQGEVVGINTAIIASGQGIGFAIPINLAKGIIAQLKSEGEVSRGWLGVAIQDLSQEMAEYYGIDRKKGVFVADVFKGDPADEAGIKPKDIILEVNGKPIETSRQLTGLIAEFNVGETAAVKVLRDGKEKTFTVKLGKRDDDKLALRKPEPEQGEELGIRVSDITSELAQRFNISETTGVIVMGVDADSKGAEADVRIGDIIKEINHQTIESVEDYRSALRKIKPDEPVNFFIWRKNMGFIVVKLTK
ncbi:MAG: DegQ family serine endoprotease [Desulfobacterales bacterium]|nr:MAG: DegQ family serine endoprotease [Desulfobacterales bacterium]